MLRRLRRLLFCWMFSLTFSAGFLNASTFLQYSYVVTHHTGTVTQMGLVVAENNWPLIKLYFGLIMAYIFGGVIAGMLFPKEIFTPQKRYGGILIILNGVLLILLQISALHSVLLYYLSFMIALQNGMFLSYRGMIVRTSHVSGTLTDIGLTFGRWVRSQNHHYKMKFIFLTVNFLAFLSGSLLAGILSTLIAFNLLYVNVMINIILGILSYILYFQFKALDVEHLS
ncbi:YoaK family protein [Globicatella sanguinis]